MATGQEVLKFYEIPAEQAMDFILANINCKKPQCCLHISLTKVSLVA